VINLVIADNDSSSQENLRNLLKNYENIQVVGSYQNPASVLEEIKSLNPHVLITDISMPEMDGLELAQKVTALLPNIYVVFLTEYEKFALNAFELGVFDYILKPATQERFNKLIQRITLDMAARKRGDAGIAISKRNLFKDYIAVSKGESIIVINKAEILYCCASNKKTHIYVNDGCFECRYTLEHLEEILKASFLRCHRSYLVNMQFIREISPLFNQTYLIRLKNSRAEIPVSRNYAIRIKECLHF
jgi:two-component system, LytTR family, response regulator